MKRCDYMSAEERQRYDEALTLWNIAFCKQPMDKTAMIKSRFLMRKAHADAVRRRKNDKAG